MRTSLINNCKLSTASAASYLGTTLGEIYKIFNNHPPVVLSLAELHQISGDKLKAGEHDNMWFNGTAAQKDPVLKHNIDKLLDIIGGLPTNYPDDVGRQTEWENLETDFRTLLPPNPTIGSVLEVLRIIVSKHEVLTGEISVFVSRLSEADFFAI